MFWGHQILRHAMARHLAIEGFLGLVILILLALLLMWAMRRWKKTLPGGAPGALNIARERYARGEISADEFAQIKQNLS